MTIGLIIAYTFAAFMFFGALAIVVIDLSSHRAYLAWRLARPVPGPRYDGWPAYTAALADWELRKP